MQGVFLDHSILSENLQLKADRESSRRERRRLQGQTHSWQQELVRERRRLTEQEKPRLEQSRTVRPKKGNRTTSMAGSRSCTSLPQGAWGGLQRTVFETVSQPAGPEPRGESLQSTALNQIRERLCSVTVLENESN